MDFTRNRTATGTVGSRAMTWLASTYSVMEAAMTTQSRMGGHFTEILPLARRSLGWIEYIID